MSEIGDQIRNGLAQYLGGVNALAPRSNEEARNMLAYAAPGYGNYLSGRDAVNQFGSGDYDLALGSAIGAIPFLGAIKAFHGSPHSFERFDMSKMLTGIGHQTYGYGHHFDADINAAKKFGPNVYEAQLNVSPDALLDFDRPLGKQGQAVKDAMAAFPDHSISPRMTGDQIFEELMYGGPEKLSAQEVSRMLNEAGVPGASYKVGGSPSQKYVIFSDDPISISKKY